MGKSPLGVRSDQVVPGMHLRWDNGLKGEGHARAHVQIATTTGFQTLVTIVAVEEVGKRMQGAGLVAIGKQITVLAQDLYYFCTLTEVRAAAKPFIDNPVAAEAVSDNPALLPPTKAYINAIYSGSDVTVATATALNFGAQDDRVQ